MNNTEPTKTVRIIPPRRNRRLAWVALIGLCLAVGAALILSALNENTQFFYNPSDVARDDFVPASDPFRIGGLVVEGSVEKDGNLTTRFAINDFERDMETPILVSYQGVLPDLFREGQGVVITGMLVGELDFVASEVLAKHDENYQPKIDYQAD
ncbi:MAG: cytochrome c maturation protein CcmE [Litorimonas sp.]